MKALVISEVFPPQVGGSGRWLFEVYRRMARSDVVVAAGEYGGAEAFDRTHDLMVARMPLAFTTWGIFGGRGLAQYWRAANRLAKIVRREQPRVVHCGRVLPEGWLAWMLKARFGLPYWVFVHGEELQYGLSSRQMAWMMRRVFGGASGVIANSRNTAGILERVWSVRAERISVVHPGVDCKWFVPAGVDEAWKETMGWRERTVILTVGRLEKRKGHDMLIRSLARVAEDVPDVLYAVAGDGPEREALERLVQETKNQSRVQFLGAVPAETLLKCFQQCDLFVLPNREVNGDFEGFGMVLVEARACGKAVIAGNSGGTAETLHEGHTGLVLDCTQPGPLAEGVAGLLGDRQRLAHMGQAARRWAEENFDWSALAQRAAQVLGMEAWGPGTRCQAIQDEHQQAVLS